MIQKSSVMRMCIVCKHTFDRRTLLKITNDYEQGIMFNKGIGRSAYICKSKKCFKDSKLRKKIQKALKTVFKAEFIDIFEKEIANLN